MNKKELAEKLDGGEYLSEVSRLLADEARRNGLVVVYGCSDDIVAFEGAFKDEAGCYEGGDVYICREGLMESECAEGNECPYFKESLILATKIHVNWNDGEGPAWTYETDLPHATFMINDDGEPYCEGIVFDINDVR